jgi:predicted GNAT superfamily acetyltransferase
MSITYKQLKILEELKLCEKVQLAVWGFDLLDTIPARFMLVLRKHGGFAMGAFDGDMMVGFVFGVAAIHYGRPSQHSHMLAVLPEYRNQGIGFKLKIAQREDAMSRDIDLMTWAFDPLQSKNAYLNLNKLGVIACSYDINLYGEESSSELHSSLGTDRLLAEWWLAGNKVKSILDDTPEVLKKRHMEGVNINKTKRDEQGLRLPVESDLTLTNDVLLLEIPDDIEETKRLNIQVAHQWREHIQKALIHYFNAGYYVNYLHIESEDDVRRSYYVLERLTKPYKSMIHD